MLNSIEKLRKIHVDAMRVALPDDLLYPLGSSMGGTAGAKAETRFRKRRVENRRQDLADGMLNTADWMTYFSDAMRYDGYSEAEIQEEFDYYGIDNAYDTDWQEEVFRTAPISTTSISMSGGTGRFFK